jgi:hypothetical protein
VGGGWLEELELKQALQFSFGLGLCNFRWRRWGSSLPGLGMLDHPLNPPSTSAKKILRKYLGGGKKIKYSDQFSHHNMRLYAFFFLQKKSK